MSCYSCGGNPNTFCGECLTDKDTWITLVDTLPDPFMGDLDHLFRTPDGNLYALSPDRTRWIRVNGEAGVDYRAGNGISIASDGTISNTQPNENQTLSFNNRTLSISAGNSVEIPSDRQELSINDRTITLSEGGSITLPEDRDTVYDDTDVKRRLQSLEGKTDNFVSNVVLNREGNKITITYTFVNGDTKKVEFEDKDTIGVAYDDSAIQARVKALENKPDKDTVYNDADLKRRVTALENKPVVTAPTYDDSGVLRRLGALEAKPDNDRQTLSYNNGSGVLSISGGNSVTLPKENVPVHRFFNGDIPGAGNPADIHTVRKNQFRNPEGIKVGDTLEDFATDGNSVSRGIWKVIEVSGDDVKVQGIGNYFTNLRKNLSLNSTTRVLSIDGGNNVTLPNDKQTISKSGNKIVLSNGGGEVDILVATPYNDTDIKRRLGVLEAKRDSDNQTLSINNNRLTISNGNSVDIPQPNLNGYVTIQQYNELKGALEKILQDLKDSGAWQQTGSNVFQGRLYGNRHIATGNINLFGGAPDGGSYIRTSNTKTENDLAGG